MNCESLNFHLIHTLFSGKYPTTKSDEGRQKNAGLRKKSAADQQQPASAELAGQSVPPSPPVGRGEALLGEVLAGLQQLDKEFHKKFDQKLNQKLSSQHLKRLVIIVRQPERASNLPAQTPVPGPPIEPQIQPKGDQ